MFGLIDYSDIHGEIIEAANLAFISHRFSSTLYPLTMVLCPCGPIK
jgi:hypothetical protein